MAFKDDFFFYFFSSSVHFVQLSATICAFNRGHYEEYLCKLIFGQCFKRRCCKETKFTEDRSCVREIGLRLITRVCICEVCAHSRYIQVHMIMKSNLIDLFDYQTYSTFTQRPPTSLTILILLCSFNS